MHKEDDLKRTSEKLVEMGGPTDLANELAEKMSDDTIPPLNTYAQGGKGGYSINLTYVDNYSTLLLVYTFLLKSYKKSKKKSKVDKSLLLTLKMVMEEQKQYRQAFLDAVQYLKDSKENQ